MSEPLLNFVQISDTHLQPGIEHEPDDPANPFTAARAAVAHINALPFPVEFVLHTGDVSNDPPDSAAYLSARDVLSGLNVPLYVIAGNHDHAEWLADVVGGRGGELPYYTFDVKGVRFICLNSQVHGAPYGTPGAEQLKWLAGVLEHSAALPVVIAVHHHPLAVAAEPIDTKYGFTDGEDFHRLLVNSPARIACVLFGHIHETTILMRDGITYISAQSTWQQLRSWPGQTQIVPDSVQVPGYNVISIMPDGTAITRAFHFTVSGE